MKCRNGHEMISTNVRVGPGEDSNELPPYTKRKEIIKSDIPIAGSKPAWFCKTCGDFRFLVDLK